MDVLFSVKLLEDLTLSTAPGMYLVEMPTEANLLPQLRSCCLDEHIQTTRM